MMVANNDKITNFEWNHRYSCLPIITISFSLSARPSALSLHPMLLLSLLLLIACIGENVTFIQAVPTKIIGGMGQHFCAIFDDTNPNYLKCWGSNSNGQLGISTTTNAGDTEGSMGFNLPKINIGDGVSVTAGSLGAASTCIILDTKKVKCWGQCNYGQCGSGDTADIWEPQDKVVMFDPDLYESQQTYNAKFVAAGQHHVCVVFEGSPTTIKCWGRNSWGQLGIANTSPKSDPSSVAYGNFGSTINVNQIFAGGHHTCAVLSNGQAKCWGWNSYGQLGIASTSNIGDGWGETFPNFVKVVTPGSASIIGGSATFSSSCFILSNYAVGCYGQNNFGQLGNGGTTSRSGSNVFSSAFFEGNNYYPLMMTGGAYHFCVLLSNKKVKCWGNNSSGQLGVGSTAAFGDNSNELLSNLETPPTSSPTAPFLYSSVTDATEGADIVVNQVIDSLYTTCVLLSNSKVKCYGGNGVGQLGLENVLQIGDSPSELGSAMKPAYLYGTFSPSTTPTTRSPTIRPTKAPTTGTPTGVPTTGTPSKAPTIRPTAAPTTPRPTTKNPTVNSPTFTPTTTSPTRSPTNRPSVSPTKNPTLNPTTSPTLSPTTSPTGTPTANPTALPTRRPTRAPSTKRPTASPSTSPTASPTFVRFNVAFSCAEFPYGNCPIGSTRVSAGNSMCQCTICPKGTYKLSSSTTLCSDCSEGYYCPSPYSGPVAAPSNMCTFWADFSNPNDPGTSSATYPLTNPYKEYFDNGTVTIGDSGSVLLASKIGQAMWLSQRPGGLIYMRTNVGTCGNLIIDKSTSTIGGTIPSPIYDKFTVTNNGGLPVNITIPSISYVRIIISATYAQLTDTYILEPGASVDFDVEIATKSIPENKLEDAGSGKFKSDIELRINWKQYWLQANPNVQGGSLSLIIHADLKTGSLVVSPEEVNIVLDADSAKSRKLTLYNIQAQAQNWAATGITVLTSGSSNWISFADATGGKLESSCDCVEAGPGCAVSLSNSGDLYKSRLGLKFNSTGLKSGVYQAKVAVSSPTSSLSIPVSMTVNPGETIPSTTTWRFTDTGVADGTIRAGGILSIEVTPRDQFGIKTFVAPNGMNIEDLYFTLSWTMIFGSCPPNYNNGVCSGTKNIAYSDQGWITQIQFPSSAKYGLTILMNGVDAIYDTPRTNIVVQAIDCASYDTDSEPGQYGNTCECITGHGIVATSGAYVSCDKCRPGFYDNGNDKCAECPIGQYQDEFGKTSCKICSSSAFQPTSDRTRCESCQDGMVVNATGDGSLLCQKCPEGTYAKTGATQCTICESAALHAPEGSSTCLPCPAGSLVKPGETTCTKCPQGFFTTIDNPECRLCPTAAEQPNANQDGCEPCPAGSVVNAQNTSLHLCQKCPEGMVVSKKDPTKCVFCDSLAYEPNSDQSSCVLCPAGKVVNARGTDKYKCQLCPEGYYAPSGSTECTRCPSNAMQPSEDHSKCTPCPAGTVVNATGDGTLICQACSTGYVVPIGGEQCKRCQSRIFEPNEAGTECKPCDQDRLVPVNDDKWVCRPCDSDRIVRADKSTSIEGDYYCACHPTKMTVILPDGSNICKPCPEGGFCVYRDKNNLLPLHGYWQLPWDKSKFIKCRHSDSCPGIVVYNSAELLNDELMMQRVYNYSLTVAGSTLNGGKSELECAGEQLCNEGYTGPLCAKCDIGYTRIGESGCQKCISKGVTIFVIILGFGFAISLTIYIIRRTIIAAHLNSDEVMYMKILASHLQMISICSTFRLEWPVYIVQFFNILDLISSAGQTLLSLDCLLDPRAYQNNPCPSSSNISSIEAMESGIFDESRVFTFYTEAGIIGLVPLFWCTATALFWYAAYKRWQRIALKNKGRSFFNFFIISNIVVLFLLYPTLTRASLRFFSCSYEDMDGVRFLEADFNIRCWGPNHLSWAFTVGLLMIILYAVGIPMGSYYVIRKNVGKQSKYKEIYSFVFAGYRTDAYYWEVIIMFRKFLFAFIAVVLRPYGRKVQGYTGLLLLVICLELQAYCQPYAHPHLNAMEYIAIFVSFFTIYFGLFNASKDIVKTGAGPTILSIVVLVLNLTFLLYLLVRIYKATFLKGALPMDSSEASKEGMAVTPGTPNEDINRTPSSIKSRGSFESFSEFRQNSTKSLNLANIERNSKKHLEAFFETRQNSSRSLNLVQAEEARLSKQHSKRTLLDDLTVGSRISTETKDSPQIKSKGTFSKNLEKERANDDNDSVVTPTILGAPTKTQSASKKPHAHFNV